MNFFNKITAYFLLAIYLFCATDTNELLKLPALFNHYCHHREVNKNIGFISFLTLHYSTTNDADNDAAEDKRLPFKSVEHAATVAFISLTPPLLFMDVLFKPENQHNPSFVIHTDLFLPSQNVISIWQPPRFCGKIIG